MAACNIVRMYTDAMPKSGSTLIRSGDRWRNATRADNAGAEGMRRADERCSRSVFAVGRSAVDYHTIYTQLWRKQMSDVAKKIRNAALIAVVIPAALVAACAPQPAPAPPPPQQPVAYPAPPPPPPAVPRVRG